MSASMLVGGEGGGLISNRDGCVQAMNVQRLRCCRPSRAISAAVQGHAHWQCFKRRREVAVDLSMLNVFGDIHRCKFASSNMHPHTHTPLPTKACTNAPWHVRVVIEQFVKSAGQQGCPSESKSCAMAPAVNHASLGKPWPALRGMHRKTRPPAA